MQQPRLSDIERAKKYLIERLDAEHSMTYHLEEYFDDAAARMADLAYSKGLEPFTAEGTSSPEVREIVSRLREDIESAYVTLASYKEKEDRDGMFLFIESRMKGDTFSGRLGTYLDRYMDELAILIAAGMSLGMSKAALRTSIASNRRHPWSNPALKEANIQKPSYGVGRTDSMLTATDDLLGFCIGSAWMWSFATDALRSGAIGFRSFRGSTYPCAQCDDETRYIHTPADPLPPYHGHCCCYIVPVYM